MVRPGAQQASLDRERDEAAPLLVPARIRTLPVALVSRRGSSSVVRGSRGRRGARRGPRSSGPPKAHDGSVKSRGWTLTVYAGTEPDLLGAEGVFRASNATYYIFGREICPKTDRPHLQAYMYFKGMKTKQGLINDFWPYAPSILVARGDAGQNFVYCSKGGDYEEYGVRPLTPAQKGEVEKERWKSARALAKLGDIDSIDDEMVIRYYSALKAIGRDASSSFPVAPLDCLRNIWIGGPPRIGKSETWPVLFGRDNIYEKDPSIWWDGYTGQPVVIFADWQPKDFVKLIALVKVVSDTRATLQQYKGGYMKIRPQHVIVSVNFTMAECFSEFNADQFLLPMQGRFQEINLFRCYSPADCVCRMHGRVPQPWRITERIIKVHVKGWPLFVSTRATSAEGTAVSSPIDDVGCVEPVIDCTTEPLAVLPAAVSDPVPACRGKCLVWQCACHLPCLGARHLWRLDDDDPRQFRCVNCPAVRK